MANIGFIGLGNMGAPMCANLCKAGHKVTAFDVDPSAVQTLASKGATSAKNLADCATEADVIFTMLPSGAEVLAVYFGDHGLVANANPNCLMVDCSTISVDEAREAHSRAEAAGFSMLDAPVSGGVAAAQAGTLTFMVGGKQEAFEKAGPFLSLMGANIFHAGKAGNGQAAKIANNMLLGISMVATSEAFILAEKLGLDAQTFFDISSKASGQCWSMTSYCPAPGPVPNAPSNRDYQPGFSVAMMHKDLSLSQSAAQSVEANTAFGEFAERFYRDLVEAGQKNKDFSIPYKTLKGEPS